jgi:hypothetical protein
MDQLQSLATKLSRKTTISDSRGSTQLGNDQARLCKLCQGLTFKALRSGDGYPHHQEISQLWQAAEAGCPLCSLISQVFERPEHALVSGSTISLTGVSKELSRRERSFGVQCGDIQALGIIVNIPGRDRPVKLTTKLMLTTEQGSTIKSSSLHSLIVNR